MIALLIHALPSGNLTRPWKTIYKWRFLSLGKSSISMGHEKKPWRTVSHNQRVITILVCGFNPSERYESVGMMKFPIYGKIIQSRSKPPTSIVPGRSLPPN